LPSRLLTRELSRCPPQVCVIHLLILLLAGVSGCGLENSVTDAGETESRANPSLIFEADRDYHFGSVIAGPGRKVSYSYELKNATRNDVKILDVINRRTC
jgi:hypothetical protein